MESLKTTLSLIRPMMSSNKIDGKFYSFLVSFLWPYSLWSTYDPLPFLSVYIVFVVFILTFGCLYSPINYLRHSNKRYSEHGLVREGGGEEEEEEIGMETYCLCELIPIPSGFYLPRREAWNLTKLNCEKRTNKTFSGNWIFKVYCCCCCSLS